jgi:hypothetical protein
VTGDTSDAPIAATLSRRPGPIAVQAACLAAATLGRLPALGAWWNQDDWGLLGRAADLVPTAAGLPIRFLSQDLYWRIMYPLFGLDPDPYSWSRLLLHGLTAALTARIAWRANLSAPAQLAAGLLVAATPLAFTPLYWAAGVQELLAATLALAAVERWLAGGRANVVVTLPLAAGSILAKESGLGLPLLLAALATTGSGARGGSRCSVGVVLGAIALTALVEAALVARHFAAAPDTAYAVSAAAIPRNLAAYGRWLVAVGGRFAPNLTPPAAALGAAVWLAWSGWALARLRRRDRLPAAALLAALLALAPVLPLRHHAYPYLAYAAAPAAALTAATLIPRSWRLHLPLALLLIIAATVYGTGTMRLRLGERTAAGLPADPLVRRTALAFASARTFSGLPWSVAGADRGEPPTLLLLQPPRAGTAAAIAERLGGGWVSGSELYAALAGAAGPRLILDANAPGTRIAWVNSVPDTTDAAIVLADGGHRWLHWGHARDARLYLALAEIARGQFARARRSLLVTAGRAGEQIPFAYDPDQMLEAPDRVLAQKEAFVDFLTVGWQDGRYTRHEVAALQEIFFGLLSTITGLSVATLRAPAGG